MLLLTRLEIMKLSIIVPVKNDAENLDACLQSIKDASLTSTFEHEVLVIDNGSTDNSVAVARNHSARVLLAPDGTVAKLRNMGAEASTGEILAFIDADCTVASDWFANIVTYLDDSQVVCFGAPPVIPTPASWVQSCWYQIRRKDKGPTEAFEIDWLESMNMFVRKPLFLRIGGFDEKMETCEDYDLCKRISNYGLLICDNRITATHHGEAKTLTHFYKKERWRGSNNLDGLRKHGFDRTELPSVILPLIQVTAFAIAILTLAIVVLGSLPAYLWLTGIVVWQTPLFALSARKSESLFNSKQIVGIYILLNVYFLARGISLFISASWSEAKKNTIINNANTLKSSAPLTSPQAE